MGGLFFVFLFIIVFHVLLSSVCEIFKGSREFNVAVHREIIGLSST